MERAIISTDWHISADNVELSKQLAAQQISLALKENIKWLICLGDVFESKRAQPENVLVCFKEILDMIQDAGLKLWTIVGNHDKTNPYSWNSYLLPFQNHPALKVISDRFVLVEGDKVLVFQSYIKESLWIEKLQELLENGEVKGKKMYLFTHQAMNGSRNNDGTKMESSINAKLLAPFEFCFFGHYHDEQQPLPNAIHLAAWKQKNFGENSNKGFYILDLNKEDDFLQFHKSEFPEYVTMKVLAKDLKSKESEKIIQDCKENPGIKLRLEIAGTTDELKAVPASKLTEAGIKLKTTDVVEQQMLDSKAEMQNYEKSETLLEAFKEFCIEKGYDFNKGIDYLKKVI